MTDAERIYARAAAPMWREKIANLAEAHHVPVRQEAIACLHAAIAELTGMAPDSILVSALVEHVVVEALPDERAVS